MPLPVSMCGAHRLGLLKMHQSNGLGVACACTPCAATLEFSFAGLPCPANVQGLADHHVSHR